MKMLKFGSVDRRFVSASFKSIFIWDIVTKEQLRKLELPQQLIAMTLTEEDGKLLGALKDHRLKSWDIESGELIENVDWTAGLEETNQVLYRRPITAAFGTEAKLLAIVYKGQDILLWDLESGSFYDTYDREEGAGPLIEKPYGSVGVRCLCFGAAHTADLLCAAYVDGGLALFDTSRGSVVGKSTAFAHILISSPDGTTFATADPSGRIQLLCSETLALLYIVRSVEPGLQDLAFSGDSMRLIDIRNSHCRVWEPPALLSKHTNNDSGFQEHHSAPEIVDLEPDNTSVRITSMGCDDTGDWVFVGKEDGTVNLCSINNPRNFSLLLSHAHGVAITVLCYEQQSKSLASMDSSSRILVHTLKIQGQSLVAERSLLDHRAGLAVSQLVLRPGLDRLLIPSASCDELWSLSRDKAETLASIHYEQRESYRWCCHPSNSNHLILFTNGEAHIYDWGSLQQLTNISGITLNSGLPPELSVCSIATFFNGSMLATTFRESPRSESESRVLFWNTANFVCQAEKADPALCFQILAGKIELDVGSISKATYYAKRKARLRPPQ